MTGNHGTAWPRLRRNLVAILRGVTPAEGVEIAAALVETGFDAIEVPLNSPDPLDTIGRMVAALPAHVLIGAGHGADGGAGGGGA